ncbi:YqgE/AlgH family protein [Desulfotalea psychrophila]|uniref:UPF0301 protein DP2218 n=1 Tax=Desulfotalea psychrophila (strain LSv54 / DSM 12343) TaxID=177439 RepID=Y2218_DESPS|nr:YqgE/AlgH family protein [Desulfotalea psychrophila]Q6AL28.1 RecName: Full=UPF0301 protein DP2218 [Desulfotalea psychrophila LSv54]CAG36947.1 conserved hypothetical protein [Desulfotalea psychrophila LSv54]
MRNTIKSTNSLAGYFLVSTLQMPDSRFAGQVVYVCSHNSNGALGLVINKPDCNLSFAQVLREMGMEVSRAELPSVYIGGPVSLDAAFVLYRSHPYEGNHIDITDNISLSREKELLELVVGENSSRNYLFLVGYVGWESGQLELELRDNSWLVVPGDEQVIFDLPDGEKWKAAAAYYGIDITTFNENLGYA